MKEGCGYTCNSGTENRPIKLNNCDEYSISGDLGLVVYKKLLENSVYVDVSGGVDVRAMSSCTVVVIKNNPNFIFRFTSRNVEDRLRAAETTGLISRVHEEQLDDAVFELERARPDRSERVFHDS